MPSLPRRPCSKQGCPNLAEHGKRYCANHAGYEKAVAREYDKRRGTFTQRNYPAEWKRYRLAYLQEHPFCVKCGRPSTDVDHIKPVVNGAQDPNFWNPSNHQALCHSCHSRKTASENGGFGNPRK